MKTILYNPIFINPQAYYVFPRLTRYLQPDNESTAEPANYIGTIEVKVIAYGDTTLKRTYTNTDSIDLSEFKNTWIRISLFTKVGSCVLGEWKIGNMESDLPYIDPEVLASLKAVVIVGNKTNNDSDRAIVKNLVDPDNPFVISNAAYEGMSGYNGYPVVFGANKTWANESNGYVTSITSNTIHITNVLNAGLALLYSYVKYNGNLQNIKEIPPFKIEIKGLEGRSKFIYKYLATSDATKETNLYLGNGTHELPKSFLPTEALINNAVVGFSISPIEEGVTNFLSDITIEVLPEYEGAFVTDGIDDLITSTKTVQEMLGGSNEITVVSMTHKLSLDNNWTNLIGELKGDHTFVANRGINTDKTGIYGYTYNYNENAIVINNILGDKNDYIVRTSTSLGLDNKYYVTGFRSAGIIQNISQVAWYWTFIANRVLTTDEINQVIAYYNLDRTLKPDILCDVKKQGITNENHAEFGDKLIDFSGNGRDIQLNNIAWKGDSGIGKYEMDFLDWVINSPFINERTSFTFSSSNDTNNDIITIYQRVPAATQSFLIKAKLRGRVLYRYYVNNGDTISISYYEVNVIGAKLAFQITFDNDASELKEVVSPQLSGIIVEKRPSNPGYNIYSYITSKSPQKINITIDEYIRYEDIVQPYPSLFTLIDYDTEEVYSWGSKLKVGARFKGNVVNLLPNMYEWQGDVLYNGEVLNWGINPGVVAKEMVFSWNMPFKYLIDNNEPKCILSPRLLRIPNSSYKILGYIPDISGHGNHGKINNSAYAEGSGVNEDGSYQLDGVDDHITIPTLSSGGKQVLMKVNWNTINSIIYDQRGSGGFAIYCSDYINPSDSITVPAYKGRNAAGTTYIDGIRNEYIIASQLRNVTHNIVEILDTSYAAGNINPIIGKSYMNANYGSLALYDFMLFDNISTDDKIKQLNEYVGIEAKVELPPYYWDAYGKTNLDADKATIQQRGVAVGDYDLTNTNFAYDKMSGFGGYEFEKFTDATKWIETKREDGIEVIEKNDYSFTAKKVGTGQYFWDFKNNSIKTLDRDLTVKAISNNNVYIRWEFKYRTAEKPDIDSAIILLRQAMTPNVPITVTLPYKTQEEQTELGVVEGSAYYLFYFDPSDIPVGDEYTVEMLPLYTNGLVYDGITDYSKNANIPALDDFTAIIKREWLKKQGCPLIKGSKVYEGGNGNALLLEWDKAYNFVFYKRTDIMEGELPDNISFITPTNYNGNVITRGSEQDTNGICIAGDGNAGFANMVFYKLILYPKTIPLLQINFLKNLMERDEIIDLNNLIFIQE